METVYWIDFSGARPGADAIKAAGAVGVLRYLSMDVPATQWKMASKAELQDYLAAGIDIILNYEWYQGRMLEGRAAGFDDGKVALAQAKALGYPKGAAIYFSHDTSVRDDTAVRNYLRGVASALNGYYAIGFYSGFDSLEMVMSSGLAIYGWQTVAWSKGRISSAAHIYQNGNSWFNGGADENMVLKKPMGSWLQTLEANNKPAPNPKPKPHPTKIVYHYVRSGESLSYLAEIYKTTVNNLIKWNKDAYPSMSKDPNLIGIGWKLRVSVMPSDVEVDPTPKPKPHPKPPVKKVYHKVKDGESLWAISQHYETTIAKIQSWNEKAYPSLKNDPDSIYPGWRLRVK